MPQPQLVYTLVLDEPTPSNNVVKGMHFHAYRKLRQSWKAKVTQALASTHGSLPAAPLEYAYVEVDRHCAGFLDWDNALGGLKPVFDVLVCATQRNPDGLGVVRDDNPVSMPEAPRMRQFRAARNQGYTEIRIYSVEPPAVDVKSNVKPSSQK